MVLSEGTGVQQKAAAQTLTKNASPITKYRSRRTAMIFRSFPTDFVFTGAAAGTTRRTGPVPESNFFCMTMPGVPADRRARPRDRARAGLAGRPPSSNAPPGRECLGRSRPATSRRRISPFGHDDKALKPLGRLTRSIYMRIHFSERPRRCAFAACASLESGLRGSAWLSVSSGTRRRPPATSASMRFLLRKRARCSHAAWTTSRFSTRSTLLRRNGSFASARSHEVSL